MRVSKVVGLLVAVPIVMAGCGETAAATGDGDGLTGRVFLSETASQDGAPRDLVAGTQISLEFTDDGMLVARAGCNILTAEVSIGDERLETTGVGGTEMGCDPPLHEQDRWLAEFLQSSPAWALDGDRLVLTAAATELVLVDRRVSDPDRPLAGTRWVVDTLITGEAASAMVTDTEGSAWLLIDGETFRASSGCRDLDGQVSVGDGWLRFSDTVQTDPACPPELVDVDEVMRAVLTGEVAFSIEASRLRLDHPDGVGLGLHADE